MFFQDRRVRGAVRRVCRFMGGVGWILAVLLIPPFGNGAQSVAGTIAQAEDGVATNGATTPASFLDLIKKLRSRKEERVRENAGVPPADAVPEVEPGGVTPGTPAPGAASGLEDLPVNEAAGDEAPAPSSQGKAEAIASGAEGVRFNFDDADVFEVIRTVLGDVLHVDYIIDPAVTGRVNFRSNTVVSRDRVLPLLQTILRLNGVGLVEESGLYRVIPLGNVSREPAEVRFGRELPPGDVAGKSVVQVIPLKYREAQEMATILAIYASQGAQISEVPKSNYVVVADSDANVRRLLELVALFDNESLAGAEPRVFVYPVQNSKAKDVAGILGEIFTPGSRGGVATRPGQTADKADTPANPFQQAAATQAVAAKPKPLPRKAAGVAAAEGGAVVVGENTRIIADEVTNQIIVLATPQDYKIIEEAIKSIDILPRQVLIEVLATEVLLADDLQFGVEWFLQTKFKLGQTDLFGVTGFQSPDLGDVSRGLSFVARGSMDASDPVRLLIQAIASESKLNVIASPHVLASDNQEASIKVGQQVPIVTSQQLATDVTSLPTQTIQYRDVGVILKVTPRINAGGLVALDISQEFSSVKEGLTEGTTSPTINSQQAATRVVVQDGQTVVLGGMIREDKNKSRTGIPILKDIPFLGYLFGYNQTKVERTELIILITPRVVGVGEDAKEITADMLNRLEPGMVEGVSAFRGDDEAPGAPNIPPTTPARNDGVQPEQIDGNSGEGRRD